ncbi:MAG: Zn-ribbon domain-containing OB-fold protein [Candidatus Tectomicrobia bacterium]|nr:Zn-ribbon domain-containing OB-fold protein [Candidatus Tectomicrobia bacterium]
MATDYSKPLPRPVNPELTRPFWEAAKRHELVMPRCKTCDQLFFYPRSECPNCLGSDLEWARVSGRGRLHSFTIINQPVNAAFRDDVPYVYAVVQLVEGPRMISNLVECDVESVSVDMPVEAVFDEVTPEWTLVKFKPA